MSRRQLRRNRPLSFRHFDALPNDLPVAAGEAVGGRFDGAVFHSVKIEIRVHLIPPGHGRNSQGCTIRQKRAKKCRSRGVASGEFRRVRGQEIPDDIKVFSWGSQRLSPK